MRFTVGVCVGQWPGGGDSVESLVARTEQAMYAAGHEGRNRVQTEAERRILCLFDAF